jgi:hypothetical protein
MGISQDDAYMMVGCRPASYSGPAQGIGATEASMQRASGYATGNIGYQGKPGHVSQTLPGSHNINLPGVDPMRALSDQYRKQQQQGHGLFTSTQIVDITNYL